jgi:hypothetical protein
MPTLTEDVRSVIRPAVIYGRAGEEVEIVRDCTGVLIVSRNGFLFPVKPENVSLTEQIVSDGTDYAPTPELPKVEEKAPPAIRRPRRAKPDASAGPAGLPAQSSLF